MRWLIGLALLPWASVVEPQVKPPAEREASHCPDCHQQEHLEFERSRMAVSAKTPDFVSEWESKGQPLHCLTCHAPSGGEGVICRDCHGDTGHPYPKLVTPQICARCHDAPGESTVRSFLQSPAAKRGEGCLKCHLSEEGSSHDFLGPSRSGYLKDVARLHIAMRRDGQNDILLLRISHRAGHTLPGGTTGRSVWLVVEFFTQEMRRLVRSCYRFGWYHDTKLGWRNWTLPPGPGKVLEIPMKNSVDTALIEARLIYRFQPGPLTEPDPREVELDRILFALPTVFQTDRSDVRGQTRPGCLNEP